MNNQTKQTDQHKQKEVIIEQKGKHPQQDGKAAVMPAKSASQPQGTCPAQADTDDKGCHTEKSNSPGSTQGRKTDDATSSDQKTGQKAGIQTDSKTPGRDHQNRDQKPVRNAAVDSVNKQTDLNDGEQDDQERDETGTLTGMSDTRITGGITDEEDTDTSDKSVDQMKRNDRAKNANGGSNKPR